MYYNLYILTESQQDCIFKFTPIQKSSQSEQKLRQFDTLNDKLCYNVIIISLVTL